MDFWKSRKFWILMAGFGVELIIYFAGSGGEMATKLMEIIGMLTGAGVGSQGLADAFADKQYHKNRTSD